MESRDFLMREIEKLLALIKKLIGLIEDINSANFEYSIQQINNDLLEHFGFNLNALTNMSNEEFLSEIKNIDELNIEVFADFLSELSQKINHLQKDNIYNSEDLAKKAVLTLDFLDEKTKTFSFKRMELRRRLLSNEN